VFSLVNSGRFGAADMSCRELRSLGQPLTRCSCGRAPSRHPPSASGPRAGWTTSCTCGAQEGVVCRERRCGRVSVLRPLPHVSGSPCGRACSVCGWLVEAPYTAIVAPCLSAGKLQCCPHAAVLHGLCGTSGMGLTLGCLAFCVS
jgi:hypothetical protein